MLRRAPPGWLTGSRRRGTVLALPPPPPVAVIAYQGLKRYCPHCQGWRAPALHLDGPVVGHGHLGTRILALVMWLRTVLCLPIRRIQFHLGSMRPIPLPSS